MTRLERLEEKMHEAKRAWLAATNRGNGAEIARCYQRMQDAERAYREARTGELVQLYDVVDPAELKRRGVPIMITEALIAAQFLQQCMMDLRVTYRSLGVEDHTLCPLLKTTVDDCQRILEFVNCPELQGMCDYLELDDTLLDHLHTIIKLDIKTKTTLR